MSLIYIMLEKNNRLLNNQIKALTGK